MSEPLNEQLSAFIDGELPRAEGELFVRQIPRDTELRLTASRYFLMGQAIRAEQSSLRKGFTARVLAAIAADTPASASGGGVTAMSRTMPQSRVLAWWKPAAGIAVAAGVAMVAILVVQNQQGARDATQVAEATSVSPAVTVDPASASAPTSREVAHNGTGEPQSYTVPPEGDASQAPLAAARLTSYVFAHSEYSSLPGRRNVVNDAATQDKPEDSPKDPARSEAPAP